MSRAGKNDSTIEKLRRHQMILGDLARFAGQRMSVEELLEQAVRYVARAVEINHVKVMQYRPDQGDLLAVAGIGWKPGLIGSAIFPLDLGSPPGRSFRTAEPVVIDDIREENEFRISPPIAEHGIVSLLNVPILIDGAAWGVLEVDSTERRNFSTDTVTFMQAAAGILGNAISRASAEETYATSVNTASVVAQQHQLALDEMQHRVKNYFQLILAMLNLERPKFPTEIGRSMIDRIAERILAVSLAHDQLALHQDRREVNLPTYLHAITRGLAAQAEGVAIDVQADELDLPVDRAAPLGLIVNELITNSIKHAFQDGVGSVAVSVRSGLDHGSAELAVSDNGSGVDPAKKGGSGLRLVNALARSIGGQVERESSSQGTRTTVTFPAR